jgi:hypothetical protein
MLDVEQLMREEIRTLIREQFNQDNCKSVYTGSIPVLASNHFNDLRNFSPP